MASSLFKPNLSVDRNVRYALAFSPEFLVNAIDDSRFEDVDHSAPDLFLKLPPTDMQEPPAETQELSLGFDVKPGM